MRACLIIHGLTAMPAVMNPLRDVLVGAGFEVLVPLLAGHGGTTQELEAVSWQDWYASVRQAFDTLRSEADRVYCAGFSLGALLGLKLALDEGWGVRALALLAPPMILPRVTRTQLDIVRRSPLKWLVRRVRKRTELSVDRPEGREIYDQCSLKEMPIKSVFELMNLQREIRGKLSQISSPILQLYGGRDVTAPPRNADILSGGVSSDVVETRIFPRSRHVLTLDWEADEVVRSVVEFFGRFP